MLRRSFNASTFSRRSNRSLMVAVLPAIADPAARATAMEPDLIPAAIMDRICGARAAARPAIGADPGDIAATRRITAGCPAAGGDKSKKEEAGVKPASFVSGHARYALAARLLNRNCSA